MTTTPLTVAVLGPGGVGGLIGALLARDGHRVICLAGEETAAVIARDGLHVRSARFGEFTARVEAATELREPVDVAFVTVKEPALPAALDRIPPQALGPGLVVPLLNGLDHVAALREHYPAARVAAGTIRVEATRTAPGRIEHFGPFAALEVAAAPAETTEATAAADATATDIDELADRLRHAGLDVTVRADESAMLWSKLCFLAPFALLTTRYRADSGTIRTEHRKQLVAVLEEITAVARAEGAPESAEAVLSVFDHAPGGMKSSMQRDAEAGRALELDAIGGAVLRAAARHGIEAPVIAELVRELSESPSGR
ncbi:ketopantoate reductase family protein [Kitasatospora aureofaciens]|uniref:ketopantoate reductase family protein n=1 Tax=Kitasatospora aureofaciens TaxID=1894 RepID=UPI001C46D081|nr:2-dehydropantoate 2-reductase [Kitasatospora aureofaciens]MBV6699138.1 2-dehydropantoate 2-reductase [Kitasatospora aureofaciens]